MCESPSAEAGGRALAFLQAIALAKAGGALTSRSPARMTAGSDGWTAAALVVTPWWRKVRAPRKYDAG